MYIYFYNFLILVSNYNIYLKLRQIIFIATFFGLYFLNTFVLHKYWTNVMSIIYHKIYTKYYTCNYNQWWCEVHFLMSSYVYRVSTPSQSFSFKVNTKINETGQNNI
jgi:hypothetical protein